MNSEIDVIFFGVLLASIWWLYAFVYRNYKIDESRQQLFKIRDDLFDKAAAGLISFDDEAYGLTRNTLNGLIRFTHNLSFTRIMVMSWLCSDFDREYADAFSKRLDEAFEKLTPEQSEIYKMVFINAHWLLNMHLVHTGPLATLVFLPLRFVLSVFKMIRNFTNGYKTTIVNVYQLSVNKDLWKAIDARANFISHYQTDDIHSNNSLNPI